MSSGQAAFLSAGGYHHHLGFNLWKGENIPPQPPGQIGLRHWTIVLPDRDVAAVRARLDTAGLATADVLGGFTAQGPGAIDVEVVTKDQSHAR